MNKNEGKKGLYIQLYSIHGLIRGSDLELGRDADTGGQIKYVLELAQTLSKNPRVEKVELVTRQIKDKNVSSDYSVAKEKINDKFSIIRLRCGGGKYIRKELLWDHLEEFVDKSIKYIKNKGILPDIIHSHYADAGFVCTELTQFFGIPFVHTGHSLGRDKKRKLLSDGMEIKEIEKRLKISHRINVEEEIIYFANRIVTSTNQEIQNQYGDYDNTAPEKFRVIPPGVDLERFYPYNSRIPLDEETAKLLQTISSQLLRFFVRIEKPLILTVCRPDKRKNITGLIKAFGEDEELQEMANLAIFAGIREDIQEMPDNEREVLTDILLLMDKYNLYGKMAIPKRHNTQTEVPELYRIAADTGGVFTNVALTEPFGLTLIEAAASGVPVVATDDGGPRDILGNCKNGILVDVAGTKNISEAIKKIIYDAKLWQQFSENGMSNVKKHYTWKAHVEAYLEEADGLVKQGQDNAKVFAPVGRKLLDAEKLIVSDIDHTLIGDDEALEEFIAILKQAGSKVGFAVATGRTDDSAFSVLKEYGVPYPDIIISSVGAEIYYNYRGKLIYSTGWEAHIKHQWHREKIKKLLAGFKLLEYQEEKNQRKYKISYYTSENPENIKKIKETLVKNRIKANVIFSHGQYLDILPYRASKGKAIRYLAYRWNIIHESILVAGDSGNDREMLKGDLLGVVVANYSSELESLKGQSRIYFAKKEYAGGIIDGINHYNFLKLEKEKAFE
ncbi:MAG: HAD-IIB family hydrolase [Ignavibacteriaceae bacterium]|nr:HAD-IIB family hydrolase [Ignavibacteriaceae bacterium]